MLPIFVKATTSDATTAKRTVLKIGGMHCVGCVNAIQEYVLDLPGTSKIDVNLANEKAILEWELDTIGILW